jgi:hypothetical protein
MFYALQYSLFLSFQVFLLAKKPVMMVSRTILKKVLTVVARVFHAIPLTERALTESKTKVRPV